MEISWLLVSIIINNNDNISFRIAVVECVGGCWEKKSFFMWHPLSNNVCAASPLVAHPFIVVWY